MNSKPLFTPASVVPAILGLTAAAVLSSVACICARHIRIRNKKQNHHDASFPFQPTRRPTAVRSPSGQPPHYLKKSPSPTGGKNMGLLSPMQDQSTSPIAPQNMKYTEEDEAPQQQLAQHHSSSKLNVVDGAKQHNNHHSPVETIANGNVTITLDDSLTNGKELTISDQYGKLGTIYFKLRHLAERNALMVSIIRCRGLPCKGGAGGTGDIPTGMNGRTQPATDPYVKLQLLPDKQHKVMTRVVRNTRNPVYDEDFTFYGMSMNDLQNMSLHFVILSFDRYSRDDVIGEVVCPLCSFEIGDISKEAISISKEIQPRSLKIRAQGRGELLISLCWQPAAGRLTVVLLKARNLPRMDVTGLADPYVKIYLLFNGQRIAKKKTHVKKRTLSPVFNESFAFDIPAAEVRMLDKYR